MFRRSERISRAQFPASARAASRSYGLGSIRIARSDTFRVAVVVSKKVFPTSVMRHRAKRRTLSALRSGLLKKKPLCSLVLYPNKQTLVAPLADIQANLLRVLAGS